MPMLLKIESEGRTNPEQNMAGSEKFVFVLEGKIEVKDLIELVAEAMISSQPATMP